MPMARHRIFAGMNRIGFTVLFIALGAVAGWAYWYWYGCTNGCAITGRWWTSTAYGGVLGYLLLGMVMPQPKKTEGDEQP